MPLDRRNISDETVIDLAGQLAELHRLEGLICNKVNLFGRAHLHETDVPGLTRRWVEQLSNVQVLRDKAIEEAMVEE